MLVSFIEDGGYDRSWKHRIGREEEKEISWVGSRVNRGLAV